MNIIKEAIKDEVKSILKGEECTNDASERIKIVILNRGWVAVGKFTREGDMCKLTDSHVIRRWGTTEGIGELAQKGKLENTKLDYLGTIDFHILTTVAILDCNQDKWK
jgi:hypothetical protein